MVAKAADEKNNARASRCLALFPGRIASRKKCQAPDRPDALRQAIQACRKCGTVSIPGVYGGFLDKIPFGAAFGKGLTMRMGQTHTQKYMRPLLERIQNGEIDPSFVITDRVRLEDGPGAYHKFAEEKDDCLKVVIRMQ